MEHKSRLWNDKVDYGIANHSYEEKEN